jgi:hypothetical protein
MRDTPRIAREFTLTSAGEPEKLDPMRTPAHLAITKNHRVIAHWATSRGAGVR